VYLVAYLEIILFVEFWGNCNGLAIDRTKDSNTERFSLLRLVSCKSFSHVVDVVFVRELFGPSQRLHSSLGIPGGLNEKWALPRSEKKCHRVEAGTGRSVYSLHLCDRRRKYPSNHLQHFWNYLSRFAPPLAHSPASFSILLAGHRLHSNLHCAKWSSSSENGAVWVFPMLLIGT